MISYFEPTEESFTATVEFLGDRSITPRSNRSSANLGTISVL
jgi:hypothetical protein